MQPSKDCVFVKEVTKQKTNSSQFATKSEYTAYEVVGVGEKVSSCKKGDFILFTQKQDFEYDEQILVVNESDIVGVDKCTEK